MPRDWNPEEVKAALDTEQHVEGEHFTHEAAAKRKFRESVALATDRIIHLALYSENERIALQAATYVVDRVMGRTTDIPFAGTGTDLFDQLYRDVVKIRGSN